MKDSVSYENAVNLVTELKTTEQLRLLEFLASLVRRQMNAHPPRGIIELHGLGEEIWKDVDTDSFIDRERASWNS